MKNPYDCLVLIVDDAQDMREALAWHFAREGFKVLKAPNGREAVRTIRENPSIAVVVSDVQMTGGDGLQLLYWVKKVHPEVLMFLMSGNPLIEASNDVEADGFFTKPFDYGRLVTTVKTALDTKS